MTNMNEHMEKKKNRNFVTFLVVVGILIVSGAGFFKLYRANQQNKAAIPYLLKGEAIGYFDLIGDDAHTLDRTALKSKKPSLIFIFSKPCSPCNKNITYWKKISSILKDKVTVYGIVLGNESEAFNFSEQAKLNFKVFIPRDLKAFTSNLRIKLNFAQTIVYHDNRVVHLQLGDLNGDTASGIIRTARELSKT